MKPENILVTTIGHLSYRNLSPLASPDAPTEQDVEVAVKLADFGLARVRHRASRRTQNMSRPGGIVRQRFCLKAEIAPTLSICGL